MKFLIAFILLTTLTRSFPPHSAATKDVDYFKGDWIVAMRNNPNLKFHWSVKTDLKEGWLVGVVERNGERVSTDFWRGTNNQIERYAFTADGFFVRIAGEGWVGNRLVLTGTLSDKSSERKIKETITKVNEREFNAVWEQQNLDGNWTVFADEICTKR